MQLRNGIVPHPSSQNDDYGDRNATERSYFVNARMILAEMWRKKIDAMKERESTRTINGSLFGGPKQKNSVNIIPGRNKTRGTDIRRPGESSV